MPRPAKRLPGSPTSLPKKAPGRPKKLTRQATKFDEFYPSSTTEPTAGPFSIYGDSFTQTADDFYPDPDLTESGPDSYSPDPATTDSVASTENRSLLDYFAVHAFNGLVAGKLAVPNAVLDPTETARLAYDYAEALLRERTQRTPLPPTPAVMPAAPSPYAMFHKTDEPPF